MADPQPTHKTQTEEETIVALNLYYECRAPNENVPKPPHLTIVRQLQAAADDLEKHLSSVWVDMDGYHYTNWFNKRYEELAEKLGHLQSKIRRIVIPDDGWDEQPTRQWWNHPERKNLYNDAEALITETYALLGKKGLVIPWIALPDILYECLRALDYRTLPRFWDIWVVSTVSSEKRKNNIMKHLCALDEQLYIKYNTYFAPSTAVRSSELQSIRDDMVQSLRKLADYKEYVEENLTPPLTKQEMLEYMHKTYPGQKLTFYHERTPHFRCLIPPPNTLCFWDSVKGCPNCKRTAKSPPIERCSHGFHPTKISSV
jgi:hypothetical protein